MPGLAISSKPSRRRKKPDTSGKFKHMAIFGNVYVKFGYALIQLMTSEGVGYMINKNQSNERRRYRRFRAREGIFVESRANSPNLGKIIDISLGGLSFCWMCGIEKPFNSFEFDILLSGKGVYLSNLLSKTISACVATDNCGSLSIPSMRCSVQFEDLTPDRISKLEDFIKNYTIGEC